MKRYLLFSGDTYYPVGGWEDFRGSFATVEAAKEKAAELRDDWWQVVDTKTGKQVLFDQKDLGLPGAVSR